MGVEVQSLLVNLEAEITQHFLYFAVMLPLVNLQY